MQKMSAANNNNRNRIYDHAVVIGSGIAGLTAAQVLTGYFERVTIVDRDEQSGSDDFRSGVPQARHAHTLLPLGQMILEKLFPGLVDELLENGAIAIDNSRETAFFNEGRWQTTRERQSSMTISSSRPLLEAAIYRRVAGNARVRTLHGYQATGLATDDSRSQITGVYMHHRHQPSADAEFLAADLVVDASGRNSQAPQWLAELGYTQPEEWKVNSFAGYSTRMYKRPAGFDETWKKLYIRPNPPTDTRGGLILPMEDDRWHVTLIGEAHDYPPTGENDYLDFARSLPTDRLYEAIKDAEPLSKPAGYRRTENRVRRYDKLPSYLDGFIVMGDAVYTLNPVYAQGMTAAAVGSQVLDQSLQKHIEHNSNLEGFAKAFQKSLSKEVGRLWHSTVAKEWGWPVTELDDNTEDIYPDSQTMGENPDHSAEPSNLMMNLTSMVLAGN
jgi:2-polyprenyl-6-methoxyphenol hydroxylase-like FAD-dependent oxidoreductase